MKIALLAAIAENGTIGDKGKIPWRLSEDLKRFKQITMGHAIIMGRKTYESIGRPLPGRKNLVLTRNAGFGPPDGVIKFSDLQAALDFCRKQQETIVFIIGGSQVYRQSLDLAHILYLTHVHRRVEGDTVFPEFDPAQWRETSREDGQECSFVEYMRVDSAAKPPEFAA